MKTLYLDCGMGAAGDMLAAALLELLPDPGVFAERLNSLGIPDVEISIHESVKCGITGTHFSVAVHGEEEGAGHDHHHEHDHDHDHHEHHHSSMEEIRGIVRGLKGVSPKAAEDIMNVYRLIADAESLVHGVPVSEVHFHEVGAMDAIADISAVCLLMEEIAPDEVVVSPVHVGCGQVECAHGILPVPAPATAEILKDVPVYGGSMEGELCTPTGAALLKYFADRFGDMPVMKLQKTGYGMGRKDFPAANCVRAMLGESEDPADKVAELSCNVDDMTAEEIAFAMERLFEAGAKEVFTLPAGMKKSRLGTLICVICAPQLRDEMIRLLFKYTTTIGIRETVCRRCILDRRTEIVDTPFGSVRVKRSSGYGIERQKYEYEDLARIAREQGMSLAEVRQVIETQQSGD